MSSVFHFKGPIMVLKRVRLLLDNHVVGNRVHAKGDVVDLQEVKAREYLKKGYAAEASGLDLTPVPAPKLRSETIVETAVHPAHAKAEKAVTRK